MTNQHYHDKFAREILTDKKRATEFLSTALPAEISEILQWQELKIETDTFIDENLKGEIAMTTAERLKKEGIKEGKEKEKTQTVLNMHKNGFDIQAIKLATNLSEERIRRIIK